MRFRRAILLVAAVAVAAAVGARSFTATAGQGLELMHEVLFVASSMQLPAEGPLNSLMA